MSDVEEKSLEDFFAKKSKGKKSKSKAKAFTTTKDITEKKQQTKNTVEENIEAVPKVAPEVEEQWKDFEEPAETDYTGLRIQSLQLEEEKDKEDEKEQIDQEEGEDQRQKELDVGPWSKVAPKPTPAAVSYEPDAAKSAQRYIPGAFKEKFRRGRTGVAPDIGSQAAFPSLSSAASDSGKSRADFEVVKHGMKSKGSGVAEPSSVNLGNRFDSLSS